MAQVLVIDDERGIRLTFQAFLEESGHQVDTAEDAGAAMRLLTENNYDVVLTDIVMPRLDGIELLKIIRIRSPETQVVIVTGQPEVESAAASVRAGAFDYLCKPVTKEMVQDIVHKATRLKQRD